MYNTRRILLTFGILVFFSTVLSLLAHLYPRFPGDLQITLLFQSINNDLLLSMMKGISYALSGWRTPVIVLTGAIILWFTLGKLEGTFVILSGLAAFISDPLKEIIGRPRPAADLVTLFTTEPDNAFPSGHAVFTVLVFGMLTYLIVTSQKQLRLKWLIISSCSLLILLVGVSRIYLGVHWLSDVIGGYLISSVVLLVLIWIYRILKSRQTKNNAG